MKKAMLLAAGRGKRLQPLTENLPKPLILVKDQPLIEHILLQLKAYGIQEVIINVCYHAKQIIETIGNGKRYGLKITFSYEPEEPLGTGGGVRQALSILGTKPFMLLSSDIWTDYPLKRLLLPAHSLAHLVMVENPYFHPKGDFFLLSNGLLDNHPLNNKNALKYTYGNIAIIHPKLFETSSPGYFSIASLLIQGMQKKQVTGELYRDGSWFNVGTAKELERLKQSLA